MNSERERFVKKFALIARILLGLLFVGAGIMGFVIANPPPMPGMAGTFDAIFAHSHWQMFVAAAQLAAGVLLLANRYVPLALLILAAFVYNSFAYHITMAPSAIFAPIIVLVLWIPIALQHRASLEPLLRAKAVVAAAVCMALASALVPQPAPATVKPAFGFADLPKLVSVSGVQISPDGKSVAFVVSRANMKTNEYDRQLELADIASGQVRVLTPGRTHVGAPQWSPDGARLAFIDAVDKKPQVLVLPMNGGEAAVVTHAANGVQGYAWRPDGDALAYISANDAPNAAAIKKHHDIFRVGDNDFLSTKAPVTSAIWIQRLRGDEGTGKPERLTSGSWSVAPGDLSWSPAGTSIAFTRMPDAYSGHSGEARAAVVDVRTKSVREIVRGYASDPHFARHGDAIAYQTGRGRLWAFFTNVMLQRGGGTVQLAPNVDRDWQTVNWDGDGFVLGTFEGPRMGLWRASAAGSAAPIPLGDVEAIEASVARDGALAFSGSTPSDPSEAYYLAPGASAPKRLTDFNAFLHGVHLGASSELRWRSGGFDEDGIVTYPLDFQRGKRYPLVLEIHGGPTGNGSTLSFDPLAQMMAAHGEIVFQPNYRGSDNLGFAYAKATMGDLDKGAGEDVVAGVRALEAQGAVDAKRIGVSGWSAGGLMTSWLIGNYNLWKAAVTGAGVDDFVEEYDNEDSFDYLPALMGDATPWKGNGMALYRSHSPITYAKNVKAQTLILSDTSDFRVPTIQAYEFYHALKENGVPVEFDAIPAYGHFPSDPVQQFDVLERWSGWMYSHL